MTVPHSVSHAGTAGKSDSEGTPEIKPAAKPMIVMTDADRQRGKLNREKGSPFRKKREREDAIIEPVCLKAT